MKKWKKHHVVCAYILAAVLCLTVVCLLLVKLKCSRDASQNEATTELFAMDTYITMTAYRFLTRIFIFTFLFPARLNILCYRFFKGTETVFSLMQT